MVTCLAFFVALTGEGKAMKRQRSKLAKAIFADGRTNAEIADAAGVCPCTLSQISNGWRNPTLETVLRIAHALDTTPEALGLTGLRSIQTGGE
jgi:transcriptional regulator with XRE-family HTH domain